MITEQKVLSLVPTDKLLHFFAGGFIAGAVGGLWGLLVAIIIGAAKEVIDPYWGGTRDPLDFAATAAGAVVVFAVHLFIAWLFM